MGYRSIVITSAVHLSVKNEQLVISGEHDGTIPIEDVRCLMIESRSATISSYALSKLSESGACVYFCDDKHIPCAVLMPFCRHSRQKKQIGIQLSQSKPRQKQLWKEIVSAKIKNQASCLELCGVDVEYVNNVKNLITRILSEDTTNVEGYAAALYFRYLFGKTFTRASESDINAALNYGYAIVRSFISRTIAEYGYESCFGIHHISELNNFNLSDDIIEPFRPLVDLYVFQNTAGEEFNKETKRELTNILNYELLSGGERHSAAYAIERTVQSLGRCFSRADETLLLPELTALKRHEYE